MPKYLELNMTVTMEVPDDVEITSRRGALLIKTTRGKESIFPELRFYGNNCLIDDYAELLPDKNFEAKDLGINIIDYKNTMFDEFHPEE